MFKILKKDGIASFVEIIITSVIFAVAAVGLFTTITVLRPQGAESSKKLEALYAGRRVLDELRRHVDANSWYDGASPLATGTLFQLGAADGLPTGITINYFVRDVFGASPPMRQLFMNINFPSY